MYQPAGLNFVSSFLWILFDRSTAKFQFMEEFLWLPSSNINFYIGVDGISIFFIIDETSMVSAKLLAQMDMKLRAVVWEIGTRKMDTCGLHRPFGGLNVLFSCDFSACNRGMLCGSYARELLTDNAA